MEFFNTFAQKLRYLQHFPCGDHLTQARPVTAAKASILFLIERYSLVQWGIFKGAAPTPRKPSRRLDQSSVPWVCIQILCQHNKGRAKLHSDHRNASFAATAPRSGGNARRRRDHRNASFAATAPRSGGSARRRRGRAVVLTTDRAETVYTPHGTATEKVPCGA